MLQTSSTSLFTTFVDVSCVTSLHLLRENSYGLALTFESVLGLARLGGSADT